MTTEEYIDKKYDEMFDWIIKNGCCDDLYELVIEVKSASDGKTIRRSWRDREERLND